MTAGIRCTLLITASMTACADTSADSGTVQTGADTAAHTTETAETMDPQAAAIVRMAVHDFGGAEFRIVDRSAEMDPNRETIDVWAEAEDGIRNFVDALDILG